MMAYSLGLECFAQVGSVVKSLKQNFVGLSCHEQVYWTTEHA